jgi:hypothetical protein
VTVRGSRRISAKAVIRASFSEGKPTVKRIQFASKRCKPATFLIRMPLALSSAATRGGSVVDTHQNHVGLAGVSAWHRARWANAGEHAFALGLDGFGLAGELVGVLQGKQGCLGVEHADVVRAGALFRPVRSGLGTAHHVAQANTGQAKLGQACASTAHAGGASRRSR